MPFVNNKNCISQIAQASNTKISFVKDAISHLIYWDLATVRPIFQFKDKYKMTL